MSEPESAIHLREEWKTLYQQRLPSLAKSRDAAQPHWPVVLDHCFARIILDNSIGIDRPWDQVIAAPAIKHMSLQQLKQALHLGERIAAGTVDLVGLDERSLAIRGKKGKQQQKKRTVTQSDSIGAHAETERARPKRIKRDEGTISSYFLPSPQSPKPPSVNRSERAQLLSEAPSSPSLCKTLGESGYQEDMIPQLDRIRASPSLTPFRKLTLALLCQVPRGHFSTYGAMADFVSSASHKTCARAVGSAMRNNPFAPEVPCHRILAGDGSLGGFKGSWGEQGTYASEKRRLLGEEGVKFDSTGKVKGRPFRHFWLPEGLDIE